MFAGFGVFKCGVSCKHLKVWVHSTTQAYVCWSGIPLNVKFLSGQIS